MTETKNIYNKARDRETMEREVGRSKAAIRPYKLKGKKRCYETGMEAREGGAYEGQRQNKLK